MNERAPNYGIDAPGVIVMLGVSVVVLMPLGWLFAARLARTRSQPWTSLGITMFVTGAICLLEVLLMFSSSLVGKFRARDKLLDGLRLRGSETVLDVGCGHGLLLIGAARRLSRGRAFGLDLWSQKDQA